MIEQDSDRFLLELFDNLGRHLVEIDNVLDLAKVLALQEDFKRI